MFHDRQHFVYNERMQGKAFTFEINSVGLAHSARNVQADIVQWDDCLACADFDHCYKLCVTKFAFESAIFIN